VSIKSKYARALRLATKSVAYWAQLAKRDFTDDLLKVMADTGVNQARLAKLLHVSPQFITKVLRTNANLTIETMAKIALTLGCQVRIHIAPRDVVTVWKDFPDNVTAISMHLANNVVPITARFSGPEGKPQTVEYRPQVANGHVA
jgi:plasmid maintenance system antidote protein VapI